MVLYAVSVDPPEVSKRLKERLESNFVFLSDSEGTLLDALNIRHRNGQPGRDIAFPAAVLVDSKGIVVWTFESETYRQRARPDDIFHAIEQLN